MPWRCSWPILAARDESIASEAAMHVHFLDPYRTGDSPVHRMDPRVKLVLAVALILTAALTPVGAWPVYVLLFSFVLAVVVLAELGVGYVLKRASLALPFVLAALPLLFTVDGPPAFTLPMGRGVVEVSGPGLERFLSIALKSWISVQAAIVLASTTTFPHLLLAMRALRVPRLLVAVFGLMWRYLFVFADEALRLLRARAARSSTADRPGLQAGGSLIWRGRVTGGMAGSLFLRAFERSDRIYMAMLSRGYDGEIRTMPLPALNPGQWSILSAGLAVLAGLLGLSFLIY